jgi:acyl-CoA synthetase (AMP-forming)/AMP-acid ligase II
VENVLMKHPSIMEAAIIGVPDERWGETPKAFITVVPGSAVDGEDIHNWALENPELSRFMVPREVEIVKELPKTSTGKTQKKVLREVETIRRRRNSNL